MLISREKKKTNIAEYVIYMWQIEELIRSFKFDIIAIEHAVINSMQVDTDLKKEIKGWYVDLIKKMHDQKITEKGHLLEVNEVVNELQLLHDMLDNMFNDEKYQELFKEAIPNIQELKRKSDKPHGDIETCFNGLFGLMQMRLRKLEITQETEEAIDTFARLIAYLTKKYHDMKNGKLEFPNTIKN